MKILTISAIGFVLTGVGCNNNEQSKIIIKQQEQIDKLLNMVQNQPSTTNKTFHNVSATEDIKVRVPTKNEISTTIKSDTSKQTQPIYVENPIQPVVQPTQDPQLAIEKCKLWAADVENSTVVTLQNQAAAAAVPMLKDLNDQINNKLAERNSLINQRFNSGYVAPENDALLGKQLVTVDAEYKSLLDRRTNLQSAVLSALSAAKNQAKSSYDQEYSKCINSL